jgi:ribosomal protein S18 acetylase RimI-like enzyme
MAKKLLPLLFAAFLCANSILNAMKSSENLILSHVQLTVEKASEDKAEEKANVSPQSIDIKAIDPTSDKAFIISAIRNEHKALIGDAGFDSIDDYNRMLVDINQILFVESERAGIISYSKTGHVYMLYISPSFRGKGYGQLLLKAAKADLVTSGIEQMTLQVFDYNHSGKDFFKKLGFLPKKNRGNLVTLSRAI